MHQSDSLSDDEDSIRKPISNAQRQAQLQHWDNQLRRLLHILARTRATIEDIPMAQAIELIKSNVRWNTKLDDFFDSLLQFIADYDRCLVRHKLQEHFIGKENTKRIIRILTKQLYPPAFRDKVDDTIARLPKPYTEVNSFFEMLGTHITFYTGLMAERKSNSYPSRFQATSTRPGTGFNMFSAKGQHSTAFNSYEDQRRSTQQSQFRLADRHTTAAAPAPSMYKDSPRQSDNSRTTRFHEERGRPARKDDKHCPTYRDDRESTRQFEHGPPPARSQGLFSSTAKPRFPRYPCKYCGGNHWNSDCTTQPQVSKKSDAKPTSFPSRYDNRHSAYAAQPKARMAQDDDEYDSDSDGTITIYDTVFPFVADSGASANFIGATAVQKLQEKTAITITTLDHPIRIRSAAKGTAGSHTVTQKITTNALFTLPTQEQRIINDMDLLIVPDFNEEVLLGRPALKRLGIDIIAALRSSFTTVTENDNISDTEDVITATAFVAKDLDTEEDDTIPEISVYNRDDVTSALNTCIDNACSEGLSTANCDRLREAFIDSELQDAFRTKLSNDPPADVTPVKVQVLPSIHDIRHGTRVYNPSKSAYMAAHVQMLIDYGYVVPNSFATVASPAHPVRKPQATHDDPIENQYRLTVDLRAVNNCTIPMQFPLPRLETFTEIVSGASHFASIDLFNGYWQIPLHPDSQEYFSIKTDRGIFTPTRLIQGSKNAAGPFQAVLTEVLGSLVNTICVVYIDDILIYANSEDQLITNIISIIKTLHQRRFKISAKKTTFYKKQVKFCGRIFSKDGVSFDPTYITAITQMTMPITAAQLRTYLASTNWIRSSIPDYTALTAPLQNILKDALRLAVANSNSTKKAAANKVSLVDIGWTAIHTEAFHRINSAIAQSVTLAYPSDDRSTCIFTDASDLYWGGVVTQCETSELTKPVRDQTHYPLAFLSGNFTGAQLNWPTVEQEAFAIKETCVKASHLLQRPQGFHIFTDHRNLTFIFNNDATIADGRKQAAERLERWQVQLRAFNFQIHHVSGEDNTIADMISRWAAPKPAISTTFSAKAIRRRYTHNSPDIDPTSAPAIALEFNISDAPTEEEIIAAQQLDSKFITDNDLHKDVDGTYNTINGQIFVPDTHFLRLRLCIVAHQGAAGHRGIETTTHWLTERFWWPTINRDIAIFCRTCLQCQYTRGGKTVPRPFLNTFHATKPNQQLHFDYMFIRSPTDSTPNGFSYVFVLMDGFSKFVRLTPCANANAENAVQAIMEWFAMFGKCNQFISDQGTHFINDIMTLLQQRLLIQHHFTAAYAPWSNGQVERVNREIRELLSALISENRLQQESWTELLPIVNYVLNNTPSKRLAGYSPTEAFTGHPPTSPLTAIFRPEAADFTIIPTDSATIKAIVNQLQDSLHDIHHRIVSTKPRKKVQRSGQQEVDFDVGDYVLISRVNDKGKDKTRTIWSGPARVTARINDRLFETTNLVNSTTRQYHADFLKRYADKDLTITKQLREFIAHGGGAATITRIGNHRLNGRSWELQVFWEGYPDEEATWEPLQTMQQDAPVFVRRYINTITNADIKKRLITAISTRL
jgi:transposase InsO family protein